MRGRLLAYASVCLAVGCGSESDGTEQDYGPVVYPDGSTPGADAGPQQDSGVISTDGGFVQPGVDAGGQPNTPGTDAAVQGDASSGQDAGPTPGVDAGDEPPLSAGCLEGITNYKERGKFTVKQETSGQVKFWVPNVPSGCKVPVVHLANGTGGTCAGYGAILQHLASHGFLATCYENQNTGQGTQCIMALETAYSKYPNLADDKIGSTGHSQGGGAAFMCVQRAEEKWGNSKVIAGHSMEPASGFGDSPSNWASYYAKIKSPMFMFNGSADSLVSSSWVGQAFDALNDSTEAYWYEASGAAHIPVPTRWTQESAVSWFRWKLLGDKNACEFFKKLPDGSDWNLKKKQAEKGC